MADDLHRRFASPQVSAWGAENSRKLALWDGKSWLLIRPSPLARDGLLRVEC